MGIEKRPTTVRLSEEEFGMFERIQKAFHPFVTNFSQTVLLCGRLVWYMLTTKGILSEFVQICQSIQGTTSYAPLAEKQLAFRFPPADGYVFYPRYSGMKTPGQAPDGSEPVKAVDAVRAMGAYTSPTFLGEIRLAFVLRVPLRRAA
jgi:hypothetical protein